MILLTKNRVIIMLWQKNAKDSPPKDDKKKDEKKDKDKQEDKTAKR
jgi:hypothetical protein